MAEEMTRLEATEIWRSDDPRRSRTQLQTALTGSDRSAFHKYQDVFLGSTSIAKLVRYEILTTLLGPLPGAAGLVLRKLFYPSMFQKVGSGVVFGRSITIRHPRKIRLGDNVVIDDYTVLDAKGTDNEGIVVGDNVMLGRNTVISCKNGNIVIGDNTNIAMNCFVQSAKEVAIGKNTLFSAYCYIIGGGDHKTDRTDIPVLAQGQVVRGVRIGDNCLLGAGAMIQDGVVLGRDSIIGTGAVVRENIPEFSIAAGVPAKVMRSRKPSQFQGEAADD